MGYNQTGTLKDNWSTHKQFYITFYGKTMKWGRFFHILRLLHFSDNKNEPGKTDDRYDQLWKMRIIFDKLSNSYAKYYSPTEQLAVDEITVLFKGRVIFKQYILNKHKQYGITNYKPFDSKGHMYNMTVYLGNNRKGANLSMTATPAIVTRLTARLENVGHELHTEKFFPLPALFDHLYTKTIKCCGTGRPNRKGCLGISERKLN
jgi:hypothetical protein